MKDNPNATPTKSINLYIYRRQINTTTNQLSSHIDLSLHPSSYLLLQPSSSQTPHSSKILPKPPPLNSPSFIHPSPRHSLPPNASLEQNGQLSVQTQSLLTKQANAILQETGGWKNSGFYCIPIQVKKKRIACQKCLPPPLS